MSYRRIIYSLVAGLIVSAALSPRAPAEGRLHMNADRIWYKSEGEHISRFLSRMADLGVAVSCDPAIDMQIAAEIEGETLEAALDRIIAPLGYVLTWDVVPGPIEDLLKLNSIKVFKPGNPGATRPYRRSAAHKLDRFRGRSFVANEILIGFKAGAKRREVDLLLNQVGASVVDCIESLGIYRIRFNPGANIPALSKQLGQNPLVADAEPNYTHGLPDSYIPSSSYYESNYGSRDVQENARSYLAVLDSGVDPAIAGQVVSGGFNALDPDSSPDDSAGHGTHMAMVASGLIDPDGIESDADAAALPLLAVRTFDANGVTSNYGLMRGIDYAIDSGAKVINLSWGSPHSSEFVQLAVSQAQTRGAIVVAAAGNDPSGEEIYPAAYPGVVAIAASNPDGTYWNKSNYGDFVFGAAPGSASLPAAGEGRAGEYAGTSISSALTAGVIARYYEGNPAAEPSDVIERLSRSLSPPAAESEEYGRGILDDQAIERFLDQKDGQL